MKPVVNIMWFRRDLRLSDNAALYYALTDQYPVLPIFIFDTNILDDLEDKQDRRVSFIHATVVGLHQQLAALGSSLATCHGTPYQVFEQLLQQYQINKVFISRDYEQYAIDRDASIKELLKNHQAILLNFKDQVIFDNREVAKDDGNVYTVFTPYSKKWKSLLNDFHLASYPTEKYFHNFFTSTSGSTILSLESIGFKEISHSLPAKKLDINILQHYQQQRDFPAQNTTSKLSVHLRFGTVSIRDITRLANQYSETYLNELIWRDFYQMILANFPHVRKGYSFRKEFDNIQWRNNEAEFITWCQGKTGYPIVDAGMRELNATGFMHNRVRMITASFLTKHLLIDWRWGEAYFAKKLLDYDYAANNGGWQWAAGTGCDASPYFRVFNPTLQTQKFDKELRYIKTWVPELDSFDYPKPIVEHDFARKRAIEVYKKAVKGE